jgi:hypothetical protein
VYPEAHDRWHIPFWQVVVKPMPGTHDCPQLPHAALSLVRSWHAPLQSVLGNVHVAAHVPESQT